MEKIKINMVSGSSLEKPLVSAFKSNNATYVVFDNEMNGTMGLPIILVSKLENNKLVKIVDQNEWTVVKEVLRMIISGNQVDYVAVDNALMADDMFFTQLTLPASSFDALKNNYRPNIENANPTAGTVGDQTINNQGLEAAPIPEITSTQMGSAGETPINLNTGSIEVEQPAMPQAPNVDPPVMPTPDVSVSTVNNIPQTSVAPVMPEAPVQAQNVSAIDTNVNTVTPPNVEPIPEVAETSSTPIDLTADKEAFLKACENMFDALVAKFKN